LIDRLNLTEMLDQELSIGDLGISLADIDWPPEIQEKIDLINDLLLAIFIVYVVGMGFCGLAVLACIGSLILASSRLLVLINFILAGLGALALTIGSVIVTVVGTKGISELNKVAKEANVHASRGKNFLIISWVAAGCMIFAAVFWTTRFCVLCVQKRRDKKMVDRKGSY
jgi:heme/copper-type cytochrome/quinol oxidase subunit 2